VLLSDKCPDPDPPELWTQGAPFAVALRCWRIGLFNSEYVYHRIRCQSAFESPKKPRSASKFLRLYVGFQNGALLIVTKSLTRDVGQRITACSLKRSCGLHAPERLSGICRRGLAPGTACTSASHAGQTRGFGIACSVNSPRMPSSNKCFSTPPSYEPTSMPRGPEKNGPQALGRSRGGLSTKIHALVEGMGQLNRFILPGGEINDVTQVQALLEGVAT